jgi:hypothetical protein
MAIFGSGLGIESFDGGLYFKTSGADKIKKQKSRY